jgi:hypothetical protein
VFGPHFPSSVLLHLYLLVLYFFSGMEARIITLGATVTHLFVPDAKGMFRNRRVSVSVNACASVNACMRVSPPALPPEASLC